MSCASRSRVDRPTDDALWRCVSDTLQTVILPALRPGFERDSARQLTGVARYALSRPPDRGTERAGSSPACLIFRRRPSCRRCSRWRRRRWWPATRPACGRRLLRYLTEDFEEAAPLLETFSGHDPAADEPDVVAAPEAADLGRWLARRPRSRDRGARRRRHGRRSLPTHAQCLVSPQRRSARISSYGSSRAACSARRANPRHE